METEDERETQRNKRAKLGVWQVARLYEVCFLFQRERESDLYGRLDHSQVEPMIEPGRHENGVKTIGGGDGGCRDGFITGQVSGGGRKIKE
jgi:hypothetical protein